MGIWVHVIVWSFMKRSEALSADGHYLLDTLSASKKTWNYFFFYFMNSNGQSRRTWRQLARSRHSFNSVTRLSKTGSSGYSYEFLGKCVWKVSNGLDSVSNKHIKLIWIFAFVRKQTFFVDLFVRVSNKIAINMYKNLGYIVYRTVIDYYAGPGDVDEDAYGKS